MLIAFEGIEGSGLTTQAKLLAEALRREGKKVLFTKEPWLGATHAIGKEHRLAPAAEALLFAADRAEHYEREIKPALARRYIVICDRYLHSSLAYQHAAGLPLEWIGVINRQVKPPDVVILLDVPVATALKRLRQKEGLWRHLQKKEVLERVRANYLRLAKREWIYIFDAGNRTPQDVHKEIRAALRLKRV